MYLGVIEPKSERMILLKFTPAEPKPTNGFTGWKESKIWENFNGVG